MPTPSYLDYNRQNGYGEIVEKIVEAKRAPIKQKEDEKKKNPFASRPWTTFPRNSTTLTPPPPN